VRDIYTDLDIQRSTFDYRELWYCRIELDGATLRVSSTLLFALHIGFFPPQSPVK
jgi:hypothetical protein